MLLESWKALRWLILIACIAIEAAVFLWFDPTHHLNIALMRAAWVLPLLVWGLVEIALHFFRNNGRINKKVNRRSNQKVVFRTDLHPFVLFDYFRTPHAELEEDVKNGELPAKNKGKLPFKWYAIWIPFWLAVVTAVYYVGFVMSVVSASPTTLPIAIEPVREFLSAALNGSWFAWLAAPLDTFLGSLPSLLTWGHDVARNNAKAVFETLGAAWFALYIVGRVTRTRLHIVATAARLARWTTLLAAFFALLSTTWFDWLTPMYNLLPRLGVSNGWLALGFYPLTISPMFFFPDMVDWRSFRIVLVQNVKSLDSSLLVLWGLLTKGEDDLSLERVVNKAFILGLWQRIFRIGDVKVLETGGGDEGRVVRSVWDPEALSDAIKDCIDDRREHQQGTTD